MRFIGILTGKSSWKAQVSCRREHGVENLQIAGFATEASWLRHANAEGYARWGSHLTGGLIGSPEKVLKLLQAEAAVGFDLLNIWRQRAQKASAGSRADFRQPPQYNFPYANYAALVPKLQACGSAALAKQASLEGSPAC